MNLFDLVATLRLDTSSYESGLDQAESKVSKIGKAFSTLKVAGVAMAGASAVAVGKLTKSSVDAYANFEQLAGGVRKLYGDASDKMMEYANNAYKTSGMSANQYMEQATSFSASLINSLGGDQAKAVEQTDVAMRAISDNFNTFGGDMSMIQGAFQGFAKQNYTMLDNLKLGYGGTKQEMERLIDDANAYAETLGMTSDLSIDSFSDIVTAIDLVQQKQGIAGTTAKEASTTIEGSLNMVKSAWENLVTGLSDPDADLGKLMDNLVVAIVGDKEGEGLLNQIVPAIERAIDGIGELINKAVPVLASNFPKVFEKLLPTLISAVSTMVLGVANALPELITVLADQAPMIIMTIIDGLTESLPQLIDSAPMIIQALVDGIINSLPDLIPAVISMVEQIVVSLANNLPLIFSSGIQLLGALGKGIISALPTLASAGLNMITAIIQAIGSMLSTLWNTGTKIASQVGQAISSRAGELWQKVKSFASNIPKAIASAITGLWSIGKNIVTGLWQGLSDNLGWIKNMISGWVGSVKDFLKGLFGISSPSKWARNTIGYNIARGLALGIEDGEGEVQRSFDSIIPDYDPDGYSFPVDRPDMPFGGASIVNYITIDGADDPEAFADSFVRRLKLDMRMV